MLLLQQAFGKLHHRVFRERGLTAQTENQRLQSRCCTDVTLWIRQLDDIQEKHQILGEISSTKTQVNLGNQLGKSCDQQLCVCLRWEALVMATK